MHIHMRIAQDLHSAVERYAGDRYSDHQIGPVGTGNQHNDAGDDDPAIGDEVVEAEIME